jgi:uncharacterized LabA/DUF88 family protein
MEKIVVFLDFANIDSAARDNGRMDDYGHLLSYLSEGRFLQEAYAYVPIDPRNEHGMDERIERLWADGFLVRSKIGTFAGISYKCNFDVEMTVDILRIAHVARPDIIVLCTGDSDLLPVVHELRCMGIRVEVASYERSASRKLASQASGFISLDRFMDEDMEELPLAEAGQEAEAAGGPLPVVGESFETLTDE